MNIGNRKRGLVILKTNPLKICNIILKFFLFEKGNDIKRLLDFISFFVRNYCFEIEFKFNKFRFI